MLIKDIRCIKFLIRFCCLVFIVFLSACSPSIVLQNGSQLDTGSSFQTRYSIIFVIHGDGDYLYHDISDNEVNADEETLIIAKKTAVDNPNAEVFIFHQKTRKHFLFFFPQKEGEFYYYRNGKLIADESYWRDQDKSNYDNEAGFYRRFHLANQNNIINMFLYFGHEIPETGGAGYDQSYPDRNFTVDDLVNGLHTLTSDSLTFDLTVLSTCYGGTPYTISKLATFSKTIIASPENLHLSYFNFNLLERLDLNLKDEDVHAFAKRLAQQSFDRLTKNIQTEVSVVVYDVKKVLNYINSVQNVYTTNADLQKIKHCDCQDIPAYNTSSISYGVDVLYRPPRFGRLKNKQSHSGWECIPGR